MKSYTVSNIWAKHSAWEYWPAWLINIPVVFMWLTQAIRNRHLFFFSRVNPSIFTGGFFSEEKWPIYEMFPPNRIPKTILVTADGPSVGIEQLLNEKEMRFPLLVKPNIGERGMGIEKVGSFTDLQAYYSKADYDFLIQSFVPLPHEMSILAYRLPDEKEVHVTSICLKEKLHVIGDGQATLEQLVLKNYRSRKNWDRLRLKFDRMSIPSTGQKIILEPIGNHSRGTTFLNGNDLITPSMQQAVSTLFHEIEGEIYYGRFDILYNSIDDFIELKNFSIVEFNGVGSEPAHIYQPGYSILKAYGALWQDAKILGTISKIQGKKGVSCMTLPDFKNALRTYNINMKKVKAISND